MILTKEVDINICPKNIKHLSILGYKDLYVSKKIKVKVEHLNRNSLVKVVAKCDICGKEKQVSYRFYMDSYENGNLYCCSNKCSKVKMEKTIFSIYGVKNISQNKEIKEKKQKTFLNKYGVKNIFQDNEFKNKRKKDCLDKYGVEFFLPNK